MSRGRHRQSSALLRISVLIAVLAPVFAAVLLAAVGSGAGVLRVAVLCAAASAVALVVLLRQSRRNYGQDLAQRRRERERLAATAAEIREAHEQALARATAQERQVVTVRERMAATRARLHEAEARAEKAEARAAEARERVAQADRRIAAAQTRTRQAEERAGRAASRVRELEVRTKELTARAAELDFGRATTGSRPVRLTAELFAGGAAALRGLERSAAAKRAERAETAASEAKVAEFVEAAEAALAAVEGVRAAKPAEAAEAAATADPPVAEPGAPERQAPLAPRAVIPAARLLRPRRESAPPAERGEAARAAADAGTGAVEPAAASGVDPVAESGAGTPFGGPAGHPAVEQAEGAGGAGETVEAPAAASAATPAGVLPVPRRPAEVAVPVAADELGVELDFGVDALEPAIAALPPDEAVARIVREVANTVRTVNERMSRSGDASSFDFFGRAGAEDGDAEEAPAAEAESGSEAVPRPAETVAESVAETRSHRVVRDASARFEAVSARPLVTHEPRTGRPIPVDLTAHDDTEQLPQIVDTRKRA